jgi:hypothetical protein
MNSTKPTIVALLALSVIAASGALAQTATPEPSEEPAMEDHGGPMMQGHGMHDGKMHGHMQGMMGRGGGRTGRMGPDMTVMMMIMVDTNSDGTLSLEEVQAVHARMFNYADADDDGKLTLEEVRGFLRGGFHGGGDRGER